MYFIPATPLIARSSGITTALIMSSPFAPGNSAETFTLGGEIEGNWVTGNLVIASAPSSVMINEITIDSTGLCMNLSNIRFTLNNRITIN
jgi:hypothetical protein